MSIIDKLDRIEHLLKHQPGRHNQQLHDPTKGRKLITSTSRRTEVKPGVYESLGSAKSKGAAQKIAAKIAGVDEWWFAKHAGYGIAKVGGEYHVVDTKAKRNPTASDVTEQRVNTDKPSAAKGGNVSGSEDAVRAASYDEFVGADDKVAFVENRFGNVARSVGVDTNIRVVDDAEFNGKFSNAKISDFGAMMGGVNSITAGYRSDENKVYIRRRNLPDANGSRHDYSMFENSVYHEIGHAYHANVWDIKTQDKGPYGAGWAEQFADSFSVQLGVTSEVVRIRSDPTYAANALPVWRKTADAYDADKILQEVIEENKPGS